MLTAEEELRRRRERGKLAQSAFRKRQAQAQRDVKDENARLKQAIADILAESRPGDRPELRAKIHKAAVAAGHEPESHIDDDALQPMAVTIHPGPFRFFSDSFAEVASVVLPFLGAGAFTFAGHIFWHSVGRREAVLHAQETTRREPHRRKRRTIEAPGDTHAFTPRVDDDRSQPKLFTDLVCTASHAQDAGSDGWVNMIKDRLDYYRRKGWRLVAEHQTGAGRFMLPPPSYEMDDDADNCRWLTPFTASQRVRVAVGDQLFTALVNPVILRSEKERASHGLEGGTELVDGLLDMLAESYMCFGKGPRWEVAGFDRMLKSWVAGVTGGQIGGTISRVVDLT